MEAKNEIMIIDEETFRKKVYIIRGQRVMLDFDLAEIYGYTTKRFNEQIKRNIDKFDGFIFRLTKSELDNFVGSQIATSRIWIVGNAGGRTYLPYAFTEYGIYMLMTVLKGELAIKQSRALIFYFKGMKDYLKVNNQLGIATELIEMNNKINKHELDIIDVKVQMKNLMVGFEEIKDPNEYLLLNGNRFKADLVYKTIYQKATTSIDIVDDYIGRRTLELLEGLDPHIKITIHSDNVAREKVTDKMIEKFINDNHNELTIVPTNHLYHDRYILIDGKDLYHCGPSSKDAGEGVANIHKIEYEDIKHLLSSYIRK